MFQCMFADDLVYVSGSWWLSPRRAGSARVVPDSHRAPPPAARGAPGAGPRARGRGATYM